MIVSYVRPFSPYVCTRNDVEIYHMYISKGKSVFSKKQLHENIAANAYKSSLQTFHKVHASLQQELYTTKYI